MTKPALAAALYVANYGASPDGFQQEEGWVLDHELSSFNLSPEDFAEVGEIFRQLDLDGAVDIIWASDQSCKDEAQALIFLTMLNDRVIDPSESTAYFDICKRCELTRDLSINEAHAIIGF